MLHLLSLLLPVLVPSWRFFDRVTATPRIEIAKYEPGAELVWQPQFPEPDGLSLGTCLLRFFHSPARNEALFLASCAERAMEGQGAKLAIITARLKEAQRASGQAGPFRYRILFPEAEGGEVYRSGPLVP